MILIRIIVLSPSCRPFYGFSDRPTDVQLKLVPETLVLNPLDLHDVKVGHRLTKQRLHLLVFFGRILQQNFLPETEERALNLPLRTVRTTQWCMSGDSSFKILFTHLLKYILTVFITRMSSPAILDTNQNKVNIIL